MVKGSNGSRMWGVVDSLTARFKVETDADLPQDAA